MPVRSKQLYVGLATPSAYTSIYTVPSGHRTILRSIVCYHDASGTAAVLAYVRLAGYPYVVSIKRVAALATNVPFVFETWTVLEAGQKIDIYTDSSNLHVLAAGAELVL